MKAIFILITFILLVFTSAFSPVPPSMTYRRVNPQPPAYWPTTGWRTSTPEEQGVASEALLNAIDVIGGQKLNVHSLLVIRNGYIVTDATFYPFTPNTKHDAASATKSFTSTLIGVAIQKGHIKSVQQPLLSFFPQRTVANLNADKRTITLDHLLTMSSGLKCSWPGEITLYRMMQNPDWIRFMLDLPMTNKPGTRFKYSSGGVHLLSAIIREATGMSALGFARKDLFSPMGISDVDWPTDPQGINNHGWGDLKMRPHDMAKLGLLYLNDGYWDGKQILPAGWVETATAARFRPNGLTDGYGYLWWVDSSGIYSAVGRGGQLITVVPAKNMIVALTAGLSGDRGIAKEIDIIKSIIVPGAKPAPLLPNPGAAARLDARIHQIALARNPASTPPPLPEIATRISGMTFECRPSFLNMLNVIGLKTFLLDFSKKDEAVLRMSLANVEGKTDMRFLVGLDNVYRITPGRYGLPAAGKGYWKNDNVFVMDLDEVGNINHFRICAKFRGEKVSIAVHEDTGMPGGSYHGRIRH